MKWSDKAINNPLSNFMKKGDQTVYKFKNIKTGEIIETNVIDMSYDYPGTCRHKLKQLGEGEIKRHLLWIMA